MEIDFSSILMPETELEERIFLDSDFLEGCQYGKPRRGHPEGKVIYHIAEVLRNVDKYSDSRDRLDLRLVALMHDTFKYKVDRNKPKVGENHHGMIARRFAEKYLETKRVLETLELHDEAYNSWQMRDRVNERIAEERAKKLIKRLAGDIGFYLTFYKCDNETGDKSRENFEWFESII